MPGKWQLEVERLKNMLNIGSSSLAQIAVARYLGEGHFDRHLKRMRAIVDQNIKTMYAKVLETFPEEYTETRLPQGGLVLWVKLPAVRFAKTVQSRRGQRIMIAPGYLFGTNDKPYLNRASERGDLESGG